MLNGTQVKLNNLQSELENEIAKVKKIYNTDSIDFNDWDSYNTQIRHCYAKHKNKMKELNEETEIQYEALKRELEQSVIEAKKEAQQFKKLYDDLQRNMKKPE